MEVKIINVNTKPLENLLLIASKQQNLLSTIGEHLKNVIGESFENERSPEGKKWKENKETKELAKHRLNAIKKDKEFKKAILHDSGALSRSFKKKVAKEKVVVGTNLEYAAIHQFGGMAGRGKKVKIPARPFLPIKKGKMLKAVVGEIEDIIEEFLKEEVSKG
ncbi:MAG: phage virion morphogenesis protein [Campylobacteraceae bacterium]|nr:phage virion morphogenesis protein [Campylobacteraceae bacterium]